MPPFYGETNWGVSNYILNGLFLLGIIIFIYFVLKSLLVNFSSREIIFHNFQEIGHIYWCNGEITGYNFFVYVSWTINLLNHSIPKEILIKNTNPEVGKDGGVGREMNGNNVDVYKIINKNGVSVDKRMN